MPVRDAAPSKASGMREASSLGKRTQHEIAHLEALRRRQKRAAANGTANTIPPPASLVRSVVSSTRPSPPRRAADTLSETRRATTIGGPRPPSSAETSTALERMPPEGQPSDSFGVPLLGQVEGVIGALHQAGLLRCDGQMREIRSSTRDACWPRSPATRAARACARAARAAAHVRSTRGVGARKAAAHRRR